MTAPFDINFLTKNTQEKILERYPIFGRYPEFKNELDVPWNLAIAFIVMVYTPGSDFITRQMHSKYDALRKLNVNIEGDKIKTDYWENIVKCRDKAFNGMSLRYLRMMKNAKHTKLVSFIESFYDKSEKFRDTTTDEKFIPGLKKTLNELEQEIDQGITSYLNGDKGLEEQFLLDVDAEGLGIRPEEVAAMLNEGKHPLEIFDVHPFGKGYDFKRYGNKLKVNPYDEN